MYFDQVTYLTRLCVALHHQINKECRQENLVGKNCYLFAHLNKEFFVNNAGQEKLVKFNWL